MSLFVRWKFRILLPVFILSGAFLLILNTPVAQAAHDTAVYTKVPTGTLTAAEWNDLLNDFVNTWLPTYLQGPVGIGTTAAPASGLEVNGPIQSVNLYASGLVGIGTTNPTIKLTVSNGTGDVFNVAGGQIAGLNSTPLNSDQAVALGYLQANYLSNSAASSTALWSGAQNGNIWNGLAGAGNVGIGTTNPAVKLDVRGVISIPTQDVSTGISKYVKIGTYGTISETSGGLAYITGNALRASQLVNNQVVKTAIDAGQFIRMRYDTGISFHTNLTGAAGTEFADTANTRMLIDLSGNVGIGTTSPTIKLTVSNGVGDVVNVAGGQIAGLNSTPLNSDQAVPLGYLQANYLSNSTASSTSLWSGTQDGNIWNGTAGAGNVGVGTTAPGVKLDVLGQDVRFLSNTGSNTLTLGRYSSEALAITVDDSTTNFESVQDENTAGYGNMVFKVDNDGTADGYFAFGAKSGAEYVRIKSGGNVGIGTTAPGRKLAVVGSGQSDGLGVYNGSTLVIDLQPNNSVYGPLIQFPTGSGGFDMYNYRFFGADGTYGYKWQTRGSSSGLDRLLISGNVDVANVSIVNSNVGIGTTGPGTKLTVNGGTGDVVNVAGGQIAGLNSTPLNSDQAVPLGYLQANYLSNSTASSTSLWSGTQDGNIWNGTAGAGNVGVGTTAPGAGIKLDVNGIVRTNSILQLADGGTTSRAAIYTPNSARLDFYSYVTGGPQVSLDLSNGNVGIGTTAPTYTLDIKGPATVSAGMLRIANTSGSYGWEFDNGGGPTTRLIQYGINSAGTPTIVFDPTGSSYFTSGNVGIGTTGPTTPLYILKAAAATQATPSTYLTTFSQGSSGLLTIGGDNSYDYIQSWNNRPLQINAQGNNVILNSGGSNVGIGTTNPTIKLTVSNGTGDVVNVAGGQIAGLNSTPLNSDQAVPLGYLQSNYLSNSTASSTSLWSGTQNGNIWNGTAGAGNVGIGTTAPAQTLDINGSLGLKNATASWATTQVGVATGQSWLYSQDTSSGNSSIPLAMRSNYGWVAISPTYAQLSGDSAYLGMLSVYSSRSDFKGIVVRGASSQTANLFEWQNSGGTGLGAINASGNVGIGTTAPTQALDIVGNITASGTNHFLGNAGVSTDVTVGGNNNATMRLLLRGTNGTYLAYNGSGSASTLVANPGLTISTGGNNNITLTPGGTGYTILNGLVGIGTTNPTIKLTVSNGTGDVVNVAGGQIAGLNSTPLNSDQAVPLGYLQSNYLSNSTASSTSLWSGTQNGNIWNGTTGAGNVGIGTTAPVSRLTINNDNADGGNTHVSGIEFTDNYTAGAPWTHAAIFSQGSTSYNGELIFSTDGDNARSNNPTEKMRITHDGLVGIGTTAPGSPLKVVGVTGASKNAISATVPGYTVGGVAQDFIMTSEGKVGVLGAANRESAVVDIPSNPIGFGTAGIGVFGIGASTGNNSAAGGAFIGQEYSVGNGVIYGVWAKAMPKSGVTLTTAQTYYGSYSVADSTGDAATNADALYGVFGSATGDTNATTYGGYFTSSGGTTNYGVYSAAGNNYFAGTTTFDNNVSIYSYLGSRNNLYLNLNNALYIPGSTATGAGLVGIGTTNPTIKLTVSNGTGDVVNVAGGQIAGLNSTPLNSDQAVPLGYLQSNYLSNSTASSTSLWSGTQNGNIWNGTAGAGNVGVGTTNPGSPLEVSSATSSQLRLRYDGTHYTDVYTGSDGALHLDANTNIDIKPNRGFIVPAGYGFAINSYNSSFINNVITLYAAGKVTGASNGDWQFNDGSVNTLMIKAGGLVGIGTVSPGAKLHAVNISTDTVPSIIGGYGYTVDGVAGTKLFTSAGWYEAYPSIVGAGLQSSAVDIPSLGSYGSVGVVGASNGSTGGRTQVGVYGHAYFNQTLGGNTGNNASGGYFYSRLTSTVTDFNGTLYGVRANADSSGGTQTGGAVYGTYSTAVGEANNNVVGGYFSGTGGTTNYGVYSAAGTNYFNGLVGIGTTNPTIKLTVSNGTGDVVNVAGGQIAGLNSTPLNSDQAVPLGYLQANYLSNAAASSTSLWGGTQDGNIWNGTAGSGNVGVGTTNPRAKLEVSGGLVLKRTPISDADYTALATDYIIGYTSISANRTVTLPDALCVPGRFFVILDESGSANSSAKIIIDPEGTTPIIGQQTLFLQDAFNSVYVFCGNLAWYIL